MILKQMSMQRNSWGPNEGKFSGDLKFANPDGEIQLILDDEMCNKILALCAEGMVRSAREVAERLTAAVITAAPKALGHEEAFQMADAVLSQRSK